MKKHLLILLTIIVGLTACNTKETTGTNSKPETRTHVVAKPAPKGKKKPNNKKQYWAFMKNNTGLDQPTLNKVKAVVNKYNVKITDLKKKKKWQGKQNVKTRQNIAIAKNKEIQNILGKKYDKWLIASKKWTYRTNKNKKQYWSFIKKNTGFDQPTINKLTNIIAKYDVKIDALKKAKKWGGKSNIKQRKAIQNAKKKEFQGLLKDNFKKWIAANKKWTNKKKAEKKKVTAKKK